MLDEQANKVVSVFEGLVCALSEMLWGKKSSERIGIIYAEDLTGLVG
jgi:hypothetical protein